MAKSHCSHAPRRAQEQPCSSFYRSWHMIGFSLFAEGWGFTIPKGYLYAVIAFLSHDRNAELPDCDAKPRETGGGREGGAVLQACLVAALPEPVPEAANSEWPAVLGNEEGQLA